jgi:hypothetical protein
MLQEDAGLQLWLAAERYDREKRKLERAPFARHGSETASLRQRAGLAVIRLGEKLAGEARPRRARRLVTRPS